LPKCIDYTGVKGSHSANKKTKFWIQQKEQSGNRRPSGLGAPDCPVYTGQCPVHHRTVSGAPEDSNVNSPPSGISRGTRAIIHRTVRCAKEERPQELASFGKLQRLVRYNSPDCPVCTGLSGATPEQRLVGANGYLRRINCARSARRSQARPCWHTGQQTVPVRCAPNTQAGPQVRSSNGQNPTAVMTWRGHRTCPVRHRADSLHQRSSWWLGL
jgi:hypothetical protein